MKKIALILVAACLWAGFGSAYAKTPSQGLKVMSFNIRCGTANDGTNSWDLRAGSVLEMLKDQAPDIMGTQEVISLQRSFIDYFLDGYKSVGVGRDDGKKKGEQMAIFYNTKTVSLKKWGTIWLSETPDKPSKGWDADYNRTATWALMKDKRTGNEFYFVNTHIDHKGEQAQENGIKVILSEIDRLNAKGLPVVLTGDFNMLPDNPALAPLKARMKCTRDIATITDNTATAHDWGKHYSTIDYIWVSGFSSCTEYETVTKSYLQRKFVSDHYPIRSTILF